EITINQGTLTPTVTFEDLTVTYDGSAKKIEATVTGLPEGLTLTPAYTVTGSATTYNAAGYTDAGTYNYSVTFTHTNGNYAQYTTPSTAILKIDKATVTGIVFEDAVKPEITDVTYTLEATGYPLWVNVTYSVTDEENNPLTGTSFSAAGTYKFTATFTIDAAHVNNYEAIAPITKTLTISDKPPVAGADDIVVPPTITATYTGSPVDYAAQNVPGGVDVSYTIVKKDDAAFSGKDIINVGEYTVTVSFETGAAYAPIASKTCVVTVGKATVDMDGVEFADKTVTGNGQAHKVEATNLPQGVTVEYEYKGVKQATPFEFTEVGEYTVKAYFTYEDEDNYETIEPAEATLTVSDAVVESISAKVENGAVFTTASTLDDLKAKLTVTAVYNNGTTAEVDNFELSCDGLRDGGKFKYSLQKITVKYTSEGEEFSTFVEINVEKQKVALPTFKGGLKYTGVSVKPTVDNFNGYDADLMTLVDDKTVPGLAVGSYKAVFALNDYENYEWATTTTLKKSVFAVALYDEEITLLANEAAVDWNIAKAVLTATKKENALPVFASESYIGAFSDVVALKYYTDEDCTEEIAAEDLKYETQYYVKAELIDTDNFELDASAAAYTVKSFTYTTPAKELTGFEKILAVIKANWLWIVIAAVALILLILIIALAVRSAKKKREREEQRRLEEKEEKKREQEERERREEERRQREEERRREEREERMAARMAMPQMMPQMPQQMPQMSQQMPQSMPAAQPMATGGASSNEIAELKAEMAAMKATQDMAKEIAELRMEVMRAEQNAVMRSDVNALRFGGEQAMQGGVTLQALTELIRTEVRNALADEKSAAQTAAPEGAATAATQVPPDAVMTTVTTTKIDTTKKPVQNAQAAAPVRTVVRNVVAPMPVDDGRVFDVGGFYKPADPV
ncbi:MAG: MBG domain-containing protein, partial [Clostridia bacterium]|nr:MBG domain-containing protein [Clostridia bacterium]